MKRQTKTLGVGGALLTLSLVMAGCAPSATTPTSAPEEEVSAEWQAVIDAAQEEGKVVWYTIAPKAVQDGLKEGFEAKYPGITLEVTPLGSSADMNTALETERETGAPGGDVVTSVAYQWIYEHMEEGWFADLTGPSWENPAWGDYVTNNQIVAAGLGLIVLSWNTQLFAEGVENYEDTLDPRLEGAVGGGVAGSAVSSSYWAFIEEYHNPDYLEEFAALNPGIYPSAFATQEALAAGEIAVGIFTSAADIEALQEAGAPLDYVVPDPAWAAQNIFFVMENAHNPNAAQLLMDYLGSVEGQQKVAAQGFSPLPEVETLAGSNEVVLTDVPQLLEPGWVDAYIARWQGIFN